MKKLEGYSSQGQWVELQILKNDEVRDWHFYVNGEIYDYSDDFNECVESLGGYVYQSIVEEQDRMIFSDKKSLKEFYEENRK